MSAIISKLRMSRSGPAPSPPPLENNPILDYFEVGKEFTTAGPDLSWRIHDAYRKIDGKECSVFIFDKRIVDKVVKPSQKQREIMLNRIRATIRQMNKMRHPKMVKILHSLEEGINTLAFASEPIIGSLHNILSWHNAEQPKDGPPPIDPLPKTLQPVVSQHMSSPQQTPPATPQKVVRPPQARDYTFMDIELRYGITQIVEALCFMHYTTRQIHRNISPQVIIVTKRGTWKLFGLEFAERIVSQDPTDMIPVSPWSVKMAKYCQPNLDFLAPEVQTHGQCNILSDMFSLGLIICALFNNGRYIIHAHGNPVLYLKQIEFLEHNVNTLLPRLPETLQEAVQRLLSLDPHNRPTTQLLPLINYFKCPSEIAIHAMQFLDVIAYKDPPTKAHFYEHTLIEALPHIPMKLRWQHVWPTLHAETRGGDVICAVLYPIIYMTNECEKIEFSTYVLPALKNLMNSPRTVHTSVLVIGNLHVILSKCEVEEVNNDILPLLFTALDHGSNQIQTTSLVTMQKVTDYIDDKRLYLIAIPKVRAVLEKNQNDVKIISLVLGVFEKVLPRMERAHAVEQLIPTLLTMRLHNPNVMNRVVHLYRTLLLDPRFGLTPNVMANEMIPSLAPQTVNPGLNLDQFSNLMQILYDMLDNIDKYQRYNMNITLASPERRGLRHRMSTDNVTAPPFNIPNLRVTGRKTSSAEDMARKNSMCSNAGSGANVSSFSANVAGLKNSGFGQWIFGLNSGSNADGNFLRVASVLPSRRLSDNMLMTPKINIAPSCSSSPGGTPGGASGLPSRRHSSIGPQERRASAVNLSPSAVGNQYKGRGGSGSSLSVPATAQCGLARSMNGGSMPNTSSSVPFLLTSSMQSVRSRRPSACQGGSQGSGLLHQLSSGMVRHLQQTGARPAAGPQPPYRHPSWTLQSAGTSAYNSLAQQTTMVVRKCPSLNITLSR